MKDFLYNLDSPHNIKNLNHEGLKKLAVEVRNVIINTVSNTGGHLASSLGTVELCISLHYVFDILKNDKIVWDVGHQTYTHKLLTGRAKDFHTLRQYGGISGFPSKFESKLDPFLVGHGSTALSSALGMATSRRLFNKEGEIIAVVGDGSLQGGMALEALNQVAQIGKKIIVILNDNEMSISPTVGSISKYLNRVITNPIYNRVKGDVENLFKKIPHLGIPTLKAAKRLEEALRNLLVPGIIFEELGFTYLGPIDGHDVKELIDIFEGVRKLEEPVFIHVVTKKGKGYKYAEEEPSRFHSAKPFMINSGERKEEKEGNSYSDIFAEAMMEMFKEDKRLIGITAAMPGGTGLSKVKEKFPKRCFDVGMAEQHAVTFGAGISNEGCIPIIAVYSTFLQRAYDQIFHDVCLQNLHVVFAIDRAGVVGRDGPTHHGVFDLAYLRHIPNITIMAPKSLKELKNMLKFSVDFNAPIAVRYPRGKSLWFKEKYTKFDENDEIKLGKSEVLLKGQKVAILSVGSMVYPALRAGEKLKNEGFQPTVVNVRFIKPLDEELFRHMFNKHDFVLTVEEGCLNSGFGSAILEYVNCNEFEVKIRRLGIPDKFVPQGSRKKLLQDLSLSPNGIYKAVKNYAKDKN